MSHLWYKLCESSEIGDIERVRFILECGADVHVSYSFPLRVSSRNGHAEVVKLLLEAGADVHACNSEPLRVSSKNGHVRVVHLLLAAGADVHAFNSDPICVSSYNGHVEIVKLLLDAGADVHARDSYSLYISSRNGHAKVVRLLLSRGAVWEREIPNIQNKVVVKPDIRPLLVATFTLRRWFRSRLLCLRLHKIGRVCLMNRVSIELQYAPPKGPFKGGIKYIESQESFHKRAFTREVSQEIFWLS